MKACNLCGKCCTKYSDGGLSATAEEIERWHDERPDIARYVADGKIWMDPDSGEQLALCPWLRPQPGTRRLACAIYEQRPEDCRYYPVTLAQMRADDCEMLEPHDLQYPRRAQRQLDRMLADSRPGVEG